MREREDPVVIAHIEAENAYLKGVMAHTEPLQETLYQEMIARLKPDDSSPPTRIGQYYYYSRFEAEKEYPIYCRKKGSLAGDEEIILNVNELAAGQSYCQVGSLSMSTNHRYMAYALDTLGRRIYTIYIKDLETGELRSDVIPDVTANVTWANDNQTLFYVAMDMTTLRPFKVLRHQMGQNPAQDVLIFEETDETFAVQVSKTKTKAYVFIDSVSTLTTESWVLPADQPLGDFSVFHPREREHEYAVDHFGDYFYIVSNDQAQNFRLMRTPVNQTAKVHWEEVLAHRPETLLEGIDVFRDYMVVQERTKGLNQIRVMGWDEQVDYYLDFQDPTYAAGIGSNPELDTELLRFNYGSLTTPNSVFDYHLVSKERTLVKQQPVLGPFDAADYRSERIHATASDGTEVPISLVYHKDTQVDGKAPLILYGYGSYGISLDPYFSSARLSLLNRGVIFAIAHIRGGEDLGRPWYDNGKLLHKKNTFTDFIACGRHLVSQQYTQTDRLIAWGGSAGGLLVGAVMNMAPTLFHGIIAEVPFVDVVTTMLDDSIPLTTGEYDEWGNPNEQAYYEYMLSYSPYDNVRAQAYPHVLVTSGLHDSQVQYWEPTKWVAKLRELKTDDNRLLLFTNMEAGHGGNSGRYRPYRELALNYAFVLDLVGQVQ